MSEMKISSLGQKSVIGAMLIFMANMAGAWWLAVSATEDMAVPLVSENEVTVISRVLDTQEGSSANGYTLLNRMVDAEIQMRTVQSTQMVCVVAMAGSFALMAIGFALFVMGAEGAFQLEGSAPTGGNLVLKSTTPGVLCFALSAIILVFSLYKQIEVSSGSFQVYPDAPTLPEPPPPLLPDAPPLLDAP